MSFSNPDFRYPDFGLGFDIGPIEVIEAVLTSDEVVISLTSKEVVIHYGSILLFILVLFN